MPSWVDQAGDTAAQNRWELVVESLQAQLLVQPVAQMSDPDRAAWLSFGLQVLERGDFQERWEVAKLFPALGEAAIAPLTTLIHTDIAAPESRWFAARILGTLNHPAAIQSLATLLQDDDEDLSAIAADALANLGPDTIPAITPLLAQENTRLLAVQALVQIHHPDIIPPLLALLRDSQSTVRTLAIEALSPFRDRSIALAFMPALKDPVAAVRRAALAGLGSYTELAEEFPLVDSLADCLWDLNLNVCQQAALSLGRLGLDAVIPPLMRVLRSPLTPPPLQRDCIQALSWVGSSQALTALRELLLDTSLNYSSVLYQNIVEHLGRWSDPALQAIAAQTLMESLTTNTLIQQNSQLRQSIALMLGHLKQPQALDPLIQLLADQDDRVRLHAIVALKTLDAPAAFQRLAGMEMNHNVSQELRQGVAIALREW